MSALRSGHQLAKSERLGSTLRTAWYALQFGITVYYVLAMVVQVIRQFAG